MSYRLLITGSRTWSDPWAIAVVLEQAQEQHPDLVVVHGHCPSGADALADLWCRAHGVGVERHPARWSELGRRAGPVRNAEMVATNPDECHAFIRAGSRGAADCASKAERAGIPTTRHEVDK